MKSTLKLALFSLTLSIISPSVLAVALDLDLGSSLDDVILTSDSLGGEQSNEQKTKQLIQQQPNLAAKRLEEYFLKTGDLAAIGSLAPSLLKRVPDHAATQTLYALSLAANGDTSAAKKQLRSDSAKNSIYYNLAKAMIAKTEKDYGQALKYAKSVQSSNPDIAYTYNLIGNIYSAQEKYEASLKQFEEAKKLAPRFVAAHSNAGATYYLLGKNKLAASAFTAAIQLAPNACQPHYGRAIVAESLKLPNDAIADLQFCLKDKTHSQQAYEKIATISLNNNQLKQAHDYAEAIKNRNPDFYHLIQGEIALRKNDLKQAIRSLKKADQNNSRTRLLLALAYSVDGNNREALATARKIKKTDPAFAASNILTMIVEIIDSGNTNTPMTKQLANNRATKSYVAFLRGIDMSGKDQTKKALASLQQAEGFYQGFSVHGLSAKELKNTNKKELPSLALGTYLYIANMPAIAATQFELARKANPDSLFGNYFSALASYGKGDFATATTRLKTTLDQAPNFFAANYLMGESLVAQQKHRQAIDFYGKAANSKEDMGVLVKLGLLNEFIGQQNAAEAAYQKMIKLFPEHYVGYNQLAWLYAKQVRSLDEGIRLAKKADSLQQNNISINDTLGWLYFQKKEYRPALRYLNKANKLSAGQKPDVLYHLAAAQNALGQKAEARANLKKAFALANQFDGHQEARQLLSSMGD